MSSRGSAAVAANPNSFKVTYWEWIGWSVSCHLLYPSQREEFPQNMSSSFDFGSLLSIQRKITFKKQDNCGKQHFQCPKERACVWESRLYHSPSQHFDLSQGMKLLKYSQFFYEKESTKPSECETDVRMDGNELDDVCKCWLKNLRPPAPYQAQFVLYKIGQPNYRIFPVGFLIFRCSWNLRDTLKHCHDTKSMPPSNWQISWIENRGLLESKQT